MTTPSQFDYLNLISSLQAHVALPDGWSISVPAVYNGSTAGLVAGSFFNNITHQNNLRPDLGLRVRYNHAPAPKAYAMPTLDHTITAR